MLSDEQIQKAMSLLEVDPTRLLEVRRMRSAEVASASLKALQTDIRKRFKKLALKLHPDVNGGDAEKTETFKLLSGFVDEIDKLRVVRRRSVPVWPVPMSWVHTSTSNSTATGMPFGAVFSVYVNGVRVA
jgi:hypothetical protein